MNTSLRLRFHTYWHDDRSTREAVNRCTPKRDYRWKEIEIVSDDSYDFLVILDRARLSNIDPSRAILVESEPFTQRETNLQGLPFAAEELFAYVDVPRHFTIGSWGVLGSRDVLDDSPAKRRLISAVVSGMTFFPRHGTRLAFVQGPLSTLPGFDHFGRDVRTAGPAYRGELNDKLDGLLSYRYTFNAENWVEPNYFTEKIIDAILSETLCFYDGCPNIDYFLDPETFVTVDMTDPESAIARIREAIARDEWGQRIEAIRVQKHDLLTRLHPLETIRRIILGETVDWRPDYRAELPVVSGHSIHLVDALSPSSLDSALSAVAVGDDVGIISDTRSRYVRDAATTIGHACNSLLPGEIGLLGGVGVSPFGFGSTRSVGSHELCVPLLEQGWRAAALALTPAAARTLLESRRARRNAYARLGPRLLWPPVAFVPGPYLRTADARKMPDGLDVALNVPAQGGELRRFAHSLPRGRRPALAAAAALIDTRQRARAFFRFGYHGRASPTRPPGVS